MTTTFDETRVRRVHAGVTGGGQFAVQPRPETAVSLGALSPQVRELVEADLARNGIPAAAPTAFECAQAAHTAAVQSHAAARAEFYRSGDLLAYAEQRHEDAHDAYRDAERALEAADKALREAAAQHADTAVPDRVDVPGWGMFDRVQAPEHLPAQFDAIRVQVDRDLSPEQARHLAQLIGYGWATTGGERLAEPEQDAPNSIVVYADSSKTRSLAQVDTFVDELEHLVQHGSPVRKSDRAGAGTKGTRLVDGLDGVGHVHLFVRST